jgi:hypothetical protein
MIEKSTLIYCINETVTARKLSSTLATELITFVNTIYDTNFIEIGYNLFDKELSRGLTFQDSKREAILSIVSPLEIETIEEEKQFSALGVLTTTYSKIKNLIVTDKDGVIEYVEDDDYTFDSETGEITLALNTTILAESIVNLAYFSEESLIADSSYLQTISFKLPTGYIKAIKIDADDENVELQIAINNAEFFNIKSVDSFEKVNATDNIKLRIAIDDINTIRKAIILVNKEIL